MKTVIEMAKEAGIDEPESDWLYWKAMERFAELVRANAIADEREAIIDLVAMYGGPVDLEAAIRARSNK